MSISQTNEISLDSFLQNSPNSSANFANQSEEWTSESNNYFQVSLVLQSGNLGIAAESNVGILERFQHEFLKKVTQALNYVTNILLRKELYIEMYTILIAKKQNIVSVNSTVPEILGPLYF